jgi:hypothetical protein
VNQRSFENHESPQRSCFQLLPFGISFAFCYRERKFNPGQRRSAAPGAERKVVMKQANTQTGKRKSSHASLICRTLGLVLLAGIVPASSFAQTENRVVGPKPHGAAISTTAKTESTVSGTIQQVTSQHGSQQLVIEGGKGAVTADLGPYAAKGYKAGDHIEVSGWMRTTNGNNVLLARQITTGERQVVVRNSNGMPVHPVPATSKKAQRVGTGFAGGAR